MVDRMMRAARADVALYEQVEANPSYTQEAYTIVGIVAVISAIGGILTAVLTDTPIFGGIWTGISVFLGYLLWSFLTYYIGTKVFNGTADLGELQRTLGYSMTPQILSFIPCVGFVAALWSLYLGFVAVRQALDIDNTKALLTVVVAFVVQFVIFFAIGLALGVGAAGLSTVTGG